MVSGLIHICTIQCRYTKQRLTYTGGSGTPAVGLMVTGGISDETAVIDQVGTGYIVVKTVSGDFTVGETISTTAWSATLSAQADYANQSGEPEYYWVTEQTSVPYPKQRLTYTGGSGTPVVGQTVTGGISDETAVIDQVGTGYIVVKTVSGDFTAGETISTTAWSATLSAQADYVNQSGEPEYYWVTEQMSVPCRFYYGGGRGKYRHDVGDVVDQPLKCMISSSVTVASTGYRIVTTEGGFADTYSIGKLFPRSNGDGLDHYEAELSGVI